MYAIKPTGKVYLVGRSVGALALGIGMRWRESEVEIVDKTADPYDEIHKMRRCVLPENAVKQLVDLGVTQSILRKALRPARRWKFMKAATLEVLREGDTYAGCSPMEPIYHINEGMLMRLLRTEFMRFGGVFGWETEAYDAFESNDGSQSWTLRKQYGPGADAAAIISYCNNPKFNHQVLVEDPERLMVLFDVRTGVAVKPPAAVTAMFGAETDVVIAIGRGVALHAWQTLTAMKEPAVAWRFICKARSDYELLQAAVHPTLQLLLNGSQRTEKSVVSIPATTPAVRDDAHHHRLSVMGDALLPVDPFEWRGDCARTSIEEASSLCRGLYGKKFHRGDAAHILRSAEQDFISRRAFLLRRDLVDAEHFLAIHPELPKDDDDGPPQLKRVSA